MSDQKVVLITGSSSGIGLLTAVEFARNGYRVVATMRDLGRSGKLEEAAQQAGVRDRIELRRLEVTDFEALPGVVDEIVRDHERIDVLVNNAGFSVSGFVEDLSLAEVRLQFETNFFGAVAMSKAVLPTMRKQRAGHIIQLSSIGGLVAYPMLSAYAASKFALEAFSEALRIETHSLGIRVVLIEPGAFDTDIWKRNVVVAKGALEESSPNRERARRFSEVIKGRGHQREDPRQVAQLILRVANDPNPKLRYLIGKSVRLQVLFKRLAPWHRYEKTIAKAVKID